MITLTKNETHFILSENGNVVKEAKKSCRAVVCYFVKKVGIDAVVWDEPWKLNLKKLCEKYIAGESYYNYKKTTKVTSEGKKLKEKKYSGTNMEQVNKLEEAAKAEEIVDVPVESNKLANDFEAQEAAEAENKTYTTDDGDTITICVG